MRPCYHQTTLNAYPNPNETPVPAHFGPRMRCHERDHRQAHQRAQEPHRVVGAAAHRRAGKHELTIAPDSLFSRPCDDAGEKTFNWYRVCLYFRPNTLWGHLYECALRHHRLRQLL